MQNYILHISATFLGYTRAYLVKIIHVNTYAVPLAIIIIINLYFSKENNYDRCVDKKQVVSTD